MAEQLNIAQGNKDEKYTTLFPQIQSVIEDEPDLIARMANVAAMLHETFRFWWTGFYRVVDIPNNQTTKRPNNQTTKRPAIGTWPISRAISLHPHSSRAWGVWHGMGQGHNASGA